MSVIINRLYFQTLIILLITLPPHLRNSCIFLLRLSLFLIDGCICLWFVFSFHYVSQGFELELVSIDLVELFEVFGELVRI